MNRYDDRDRDERRGYGPRRAGEMPYDRGWSYGDQGYTRGGEIDWDMIGEDDDGDRESGGRGRERYLRPSREEERRSGVSQQTFEYGWGGDGYDTGGNADRSQRGYRRPDSRIADDICDRLTRHGWIDASDIEVRVEDGEVTLEGTVDSRRTKRLAEEVAESISGVQDVHNRLRIAQSQDVGRATR